MYGEGNSSFGQKPSMSSPDKGKNGQQSGSQGGEGYRGNNYEAMYQKVQREDASRLRSNRKAKS